MNRLAPALVALAVAAACKSSAPYTVPAAALNTGVALGIFLLIAVRNPSAHRSLIAFAAWSSFAHAVVMSLLGLKIPEQRSGFLIGSGVLVVIGGALLALAPRKTTAQSATATAA